MVVTGGGGYIMELITRAKTHLSVILVDVDEDTKKNFQQACDLGLIEKVQLSGEAVESEEEKEIQEAFL